VIRNFYYYGKYLLKKFKVNKKQFIRIINEEIVGFNLLGNEDFQKQFICDSLLSIGDYKKTARNNKIKINVTDARVGGDWEEDFEDASHITLDYYLDIDYLYDQAKEPVKLRLIFDSERIEISKGGYHTPARLGGTTDSDRPEEGEAYFTSFNWDNIEVTLWTIDGEQIEFTAFNNAPYNIKTLFKMEYCKDYITNNTLPVERNDRKFMGLSKSPYC
jgi:hypothetical protein